MWLSKNHKQHFVSKFNQHLVPLLQVYNYKQSKSANLLQASSFFGHFVWKLFSILYTFIFFISLFFVNGL